MNLQDYGPAVSHGAGQFQRGKHLIEAAYQRTRGTIVRVFHADNSVTSIVYPADTGKLEACRLAIEDLKDCECARPHFVQVRPAVGPSVPEVLDLT